MIVTEERTASRQALVAYRGNRYTVPPREAASAVVTTSPLAVQPALRPLPPLTVWMIFFWPTVTFWLPRTRLPYFTRPVTSLMTPRPKIVFLNLDDSEEVNWRKIVTSGHSYFPVYQTNRDQIVGMVAVVVATSGGDSVPAGAEGAAADDFTYTGVAPTVTTISPTSGSTVGNTLITITGTGFITGTTVKFGTLSGTAVTVVSSTSITVTSPATCALGWASTSSAKRRTARPCSAVIQPAGPERAVGLISCTYYKDPSDPQWKNDDGVRVPARSSAPKWPWQIDCLNRRSDRKCC